jgi:hypothetical protein
VNNVLTILTNSGIDAEDIRTNAYNVLKNISNIFIDFEDSEVEIDEENNADEADFIANLTRNNTGSLYFY